MFKQGKGDVWMEGRKVKPAAMSQLLLLRIIRPLGQSQRTKIRAAQSRMTNAVDIVLSFSLYNTHYL